MKLVLLLLVVPVVLAGDFGKMWQELEEELKHQVSDAESANPDGGSKHDGGRDAQDNKGSQGWGGKDSQGGDDQGSQGAGDEEPQGEVDQESQGEGGQDSKGWGDKDSKGWKDKDSKGWGDKDSKGWGDKNSKDQGRKVRNDDQGSNSHSPLGGDRQTNSNASQPPLDSTRQPASTTPQPSGGDQEPDDSNSNDEEPRKATYEQFKGWLDSQRRGGSNRDDKRDGDRRGNRKDDEEDDRSDRRRGNRDDDKDDDTNDNNNDDSNDDNKDDQEDGGDEKGDFIQRNIVKFKEFVRMKALKEKEEREAKQEIRQQMEKVFLQKILKEKLVDLTSQFDEEKERFTLNIASHFLEFCECDNSRKVLDRLTNGSFAGPEFEDDDLSYDDDEDWANPWDSEMANNSDSTTPGPNTITTRLPGNYTWNNGSSGNETDGNYTGGSDLSNGEDGWESLIGDNDFTAERIREKVEWFSELDQKEQLKYVLHDLVDIMCRSARQYLSFVGHFEQAVIDFRKEDN